MDSSEGFGNAAVVADLWRFYEEHAEHARQHETLRATVTSTLAAIAAAIVGLAGVGGLTRSDIPAGLVVLVLSGLGVALSLKHYERFKMHSAIMKEVRKEIERLRQPHAARSTQALRDAGVKEHEDNFSASKRTKKRGVSPWVRVRLHVLWLGLPVGIGLVGLLLIVLALIGVTSK